jgi:hypothetical protein
VFGFEEQMAMSNDDATTHGRSGRIAELRESIRHTFPAEIFTQSITPCDQTRDDPELDEEKYLYESLKGRKWTEVPPQVLTNQPDGYMLLTAEAFKALLAAWLIRSLDNIDSENEVRDLVVYAFSPKHDMVPDTTDFILHRLRALSAEQRDTLHSLLLEFAERDSSAFQRKLAAEAVALIDSLH